MASNTHGNSIDQKSVNAVAYERRASCRFLTTFRTGRLSHNANDELCSIRNISAGGAIATAANEYVLGDRITLDLRYDEGLEARVSWVNGSQIGLAFEKIINVDDILVNVSRDGRRARAPRLAASSPGRLHVGDDVFEIVTNDISQGGVKISTGRKFRAGTVCKLWLENIGIHRAVVRWSTEDEAGLSFEETLPVARINDWVRDQRLRLQSILRFRLSAAT